MDGTWEKCPLKTSSSGPPLNLAADYIQSRKKPLDASAAEVFGRIAMYSGHAPFRKADMDFYLDSHFAS